jgi:hypothetical protein
MSTWWSSFAGRTASVPFGPDCLADVHSKRHLLPVLTPSMWTHAKAMFGDVAIPAENLITVREALPSEPAVESNTSKPTRIAAKHAGSSLPLSGTIAVDVVQCEEYERADAAAGTPWRGATVPLEYLKSESIIRLGRQLFVPFWISLLLEAVQFTRAFWVLFFPAPLGDGRTLSAAAIGGVWVTRVQLAARRVHRLTVAVTQLNSRGGVV